MIQGNNATNLSPLNGLDDVVGGATSGSSKFPVEPGHFRNVIEAFSAGCPRSVSERNSSDTRRPICA